ncbi:c-type cytochrome [Desulfosporosinus sp. SYSU MS00001]|uniref:c-type cytochrome n=1 Tax=Desulfosporosinus sp. SYSU MS00001 TaxID=3416284 RepID=UPI003CF17DC4
MLQTKVWRNLIISIAVTIIAVAVLTQSIQSAQTSQSNQAGQTPSSNTSSTSSSTTQVSGVNLYNTYCSACHGSNGSGASGPALNTGSWSDSAKVQTIVKSGKGGMPGFQGQLSDPQIKAIGDYVAALKK